MKNILNNFAHKKSFGELVRYLIVGIFNTLVGFGITIFLTYIAITPELANLIGWLFGTAVSFFLNARFTFKTAPTFGAYWRFMASMLAAFLINILVLSLAYRACGLNVYLAQVIAAVAYTASGFFLSKFFAFKSAQKPE